MTSEPVPEATGAEPVSEPAPPSPGRRVFISYSGEDLAVAGKVCGLLEADGVACWIAPRDVRPRPEYGEQIIGAIEAAPALVLILSGNANASIFVPTEVERAFSKGKAVFVLRVEDVQPSRALELFVSRGQWVDAWKPPLEARVATLAEAIRSMLGLQPVSGETGSPPAVRRRRLTRRRVVGFGLVGIAALAVAALVGDLLLTPYGAAATAAPPSASPAATATPQPTAMGPGFHLTGSMAGARQGHTATLLLDGRVLLAGGSDGSKVLASAEVYDPRTGTFSPTGPMKVAREGHTATLLPNGHVLITGGFDNSLDTASNTDLVGLESAELYDPVRGTFSPTGSMAYARQHHSATLLPGGRVLVAGGYGEEHVDPVVGTAYLVEPLASAEVYDPLTGKFSRTGAMSLVRIDHTATLLASGRVLVAGGWNASQSALASAELYDPTTGTFGPTGPMVQARRAFGAILMPDGHVLLVGGDDGTYTALASAELYDPATGKFSTTGSMTQARWGGTATLLPDWRFLIAGGDQKDPETTHYFSIASAEVFDPKTSSFVAAGSMTFDRDLHTATLLPDGRVLIAGGNSYGALASAELYKP